MKFDETMLSGYIDGELSEEERKLVEKHLADNPKDRELLRTLTDLHHKLLAMPEEIFREDPVQRVRQRIEAERLNSAAKNLSDQGQRRSNTIVWWSLLALAASLLIAVGVMRQQPFTSLASNAEPTGNRSPAGRVERVGHMEDSGSIEPVESMAVAGGIGPADYPDGNGPAALDQSAAQMAPSNMTADNPANTKPDPKSMKATDMDTESPQSFLRSDGAELAMADFAMATSAAPAADIHDQLPSRLLTFNVEDGKPGGISQLKAAADLAFESSQSISFQVPEGFTDDTLRLITDFITNIEPPSRSENEDVGRPTDSIPTGFDSDLKVDKTEPVAVYVQASPEQLAGLIQALRNWSLQIEQQGVASLPEVVEDGAFREMSRAMTATEVPSHAADVLPRSVEAESIGSTKPELGEDAENSLRQGRIWILIRPK